MPKKLALVTWLVDGSFGVMPLSASKTSDSDLFVGSKTMMKWKGKKWYEVQILKISDDSKLLNKLCDDLISMKISVEDLLEDDECLVSSTDVTPVKLPPPTKRKVSAASRVLKMSKQLKETEILSEVANAASIQSASKRAHTLFGNASKVKRVKAAEQVTSDSEDDGLELAYERGRKKYKATSESENESDSPKPGTSAELRRALDEINQLKKQMEETVKSVSVTKNIVAHSNFDSLHKSVIVESSDSHSTPPVDRDRSTPSTAPSKKFPGVTPSRAAGNTDNTQYKKQPKMIELVPGYGVMLSQRQLDEAVDNSNNSGTRLVRNLMSAFFPKEVLAKSSALGGRINTALDKDIVAACLRFVQSKHQIAKTNLIDAINDKCANARRASKAAAKSQ